MLWENMNATLAEKVWSRLLINVAYSLIVAASFGIAKVEFLEDALSIPPSPSLTFSFAVNLRFWPDTECFGSRAPGFKELEFVARSLTRLEPRLFSSLELAS